MDHYILEIPFTAYVRCLAKFEEQSREWLLLKNSVILRNDGTADTMVHLRCDAEKAELIHKVIARECPDFCNQVRSRIDSAVEA